MKTSILNTLALALTLNTAAFAQKYDLTGAITLTNPTCYGQTNGSISLNTFGGTEPYTYYWSNGDTTSSLSNLGAGTYHVIVTDANLTFFETDIVLTTPDEIIISGTVTDVSNYGGSDGAIDLNVLGTAGNFSFVWSSTDGAGYDVGVFDQSNLTAGLYSFSITNENGCSASAAFTVGQPLPNTSNEMIANEDPFQLTSLNANGVGAVAFPNPSTGTIHFRTGTQTKNLEIYDQFGGLVQASNIVMESAEVQTMDLKSGNYIAVFYLVDGTSYKQVFTVR